MSVDRQNSAFCLLLAATCASEAALDRALGEFFLTARQYAVLAVAGAAAGLNPECLWDECEADRQSKRELVGSLIDRGLLVPRRGANDKSRLSHFALTIEGAKALAEAGFVIQALNNRLLKLVPADRRSDFLRALEILSARPHGLTRSLKHIL